MAAPDPLRGTAEEFTKKDWVEAVANFRPSGPNFLSRQKAEANLVGYIDSRKIRGCLRYCLGYNAIHRISPSSGTRLLRTNPVTHPIYPDLYCTGAAEEEFSPIRGNVGVSDAKLFGNTQFFDNDPHDTVKEPLGKESNISQSLRGSYRKARVTLRFEPLLGYVLNDERMVSEGTVLSESRRNTWMDQESRVDIVSLSGFQLKYAEGTGLPAGFSSPLGNAYPAEIGQVIVKSDVRVMWRDVPETYLFGGDTSSVTRDRRPARILYRLGTVNDAAFFGYPRGTLALMGVRMVRTPWPLYVPIKELGDAFEDHWEYTVEFLMTYFNPEKGFTGNPAAKITDNLGWNNSIWRGSLTGADGNAGLWFLATYDGQTIFPKVAGNKEGSNCQFAYTDFTKLFDAHDNGLSSGE